MLHHAFIVSWLHTIVEASTNVAFRTVRIARRRAQAARHGGVCAVMGLAAFGGATLRDVLLDRRPFFSVAHSGCHRHSFQCRPEVIAPQLHSSTLAASVSGRHGDGARLQLA